MPHPPDAADPFSPDPFAAVPDPGGAGSLDDLVERLRLLKVWAGDPSYEVVKDRVNAGWAATGRPASDLARKTTVADCFKLGRRRVNTDLVLAVVHALHPDVGYVAQWRQALRVVGGEAAAASQVRVQDVLPADPAGFTGRTAESAALRRALEEGAVTVLAGMAGVGKTRLAVRAAHLARRDGVVDRVLFVDLRGFHPDPAQPPADPAAVLDGFLRLLGVPGHEVPHDLPGRTAAYRDRLAGTRTLVVLDNAATTDQVRPLLPATPGCPALVTSRRDLPGPGFGHLAVDVFAAEEAACFLGDAVRGVPVGADPRAAARVADRCGHLPLALDLVVGHVRATPGWTLTDHADRLDERHRDRRLDSGVELALDLSYRHLPGDRRRLLRLLALHPGPDVDGHAAAALAGTDLATARRLLDDLCGDHLLQRPAPGRYGFHDLVRAHASGRAVDEDRPAERRAALTRLFDHYLATSAAAMDVLSPAEADLRPRVGPPSSPVPALEDREAARDWLDAERPTLVAVAAHTAAHGWPEHTTRLSTTLYRYLTGGHCGDALAVHGHAHRAAVDLADPTAQANALSNLGTAHMQRGSHESAADHFRRALVLFERVDDLVGQGRVLHNLGIVEERLGRCAAAVGHARRALALCRRTGDRLGEAHGLNIIAHLLAKQGDRAEAAERHREAWALFRSTGDRTGEANTLLNLGEVESALGRLDAAGEHLGRALELYREVGDHDGVAWVLDGLGTLHVRLGRPDEAAGHYGRALDAHRDMGNRDGQAWALAGLGEAALAAGRPAEAVAHHEAAEAIAADIGARDQRARAHAGLGHAQRALGDEAGAREHFARAAGMYAELGMPEAGEVRAHLTAGGA
ncbi:tetratricopeptide repeat protein [Saccharothrix sp. Mg75]|uniref:tetratricopeptide repeat protein n=1 Tax=Saccharothrix sp. Mg75 TaxID=3445357 RepID=UPI003EE8C522